jgi:hypothetical protein
MPYEKRLHPVACDICGQEVSDEEDDWTSLEYPHKCQICGKVLCGKCAYYVEIDCCENQDEKSKYCTQTRLEIFECCKEHLKKIEEEIEILQHLKDNPSARTTEEGV